MFYYLECSQWRGDKSMALFGICRVRDWADDIGSVCETSREYPEYRRKTEDTVINHVNAC